LPAAAGGICESEPAHQRGPEEKMMTTRQIVPLQSDSEKVVETNRAAQFGFAQERQAAVAKKLPGRG
jgi:hypothetical protein